MRSRRGSAANGLIVLGAQLRASVLWQERCGRLPYLFQTRLTLMIAGFRVVTFDQVKASYIQQVRALIAGGSDLLLVETIFDSLNAKAALVAIREVFDQDGKELPVDDLSSRRPRWRDDDFRANREAFWNAVEHVNPLSVGLNCSLGPGPYVSVLE